jgi:hypothetical protein
VLSRVFGSKFILKVFKRGYFSNQNQRIPIFASLGVPLRSLK